MSAASGFEEFVTIVDQGSLTAAAQSLEIPRATLGRRLARLEERLGVRLIHRTTRRMKMTQHGESLYPKALRVVRTAQQAEAEVRRLDGVPRGLLRVSIPAAVPAEVFTRWLIDFLRAFPEVQLDVRGANTKVDLVAEGIDVALSANRVDDPSLVVKTLLWNTRLAVASPQYLADRGRPIQAADLSRHDCIVGHQRSGVPEHRWPLFDGGSVEVSGTLAIDQMGMRVEAARQHLGIAFEIENGVSELLSKGALVRVLPDIVGQRERLCLLYPDRTFLDPKVRAFVDFIASRVRETLSGRPV